MTSQTTNGCTHDWKFFGECLLCRASQQQRDFDNNLIRKRAEWDEKRALYEQLDRIESMLKELLEKKC